MADHDLPWFKFFPRDWLAEESTSLMTLREKGAYIDLLARSWADGGIPDDPAKVARLLRVSEDEMREMWPVLREQFAEDGRGRLVHVDLAYQRDEVLERKRALSEAGRKGAAKTNRKRWGIGHPDAQADGHPDGHPDGHHDGHPDGHPDRGADGHRDDFVGHPDGLASPSSDAEAEGDGRGSHLRVGRSTETEGENRLQVEGPEGTETAEAEPTTCPGCGGGKKPGEEVCESCQYLERTLHRGAS